MKTAGLLGIVGEKCRMGRLRGLEVHASEALMKKPFPASLCEFGKCDVTCCSGGCRLSFEDIVELGPFMADVFVKAGLGSAGLTLSFVGESREAGYEMIRGFLCSSKKLGCVFADTKSGGCLLHSHAIAMGLEWRRHKPFTCVLYPVRVSYLEAGRRGIVLKPSTEHSICRHLTHRKGAPASTKTYMDVKWDDIRYLFDLREPAAKDKVA